jgi:CheY-like chemotaxis protein
VRPAPSFGASGDAHDARCFREPLAPRSRRFPLWATFQASVDAEKYGHAIDHYAQTVVMWLLFGGVAARYWVLLHNALCERLSKSGFCLKPLAFGSVVQHTARTRDATMLLIVDDDPRFLEEAERVLSAYGGVLFARDSDQAFSLMRNVGSDVTAALVNLNLPGHDGFSLIEEMRKHYPDLPVIAISGVLQDHVLHGARALGVVDALRKPITAEWNTAISRVRTKVANR